MRHAYKTLHLLLCAPAFGQTLTVEPPVAKPGRIAELLIKDKPADAVVTLTPGPDSDYRPCNGDKFYLSGAGGARWVDVNFTTPLNPPQEVTRDVLIPGPTWPGNPLDLTKETITFVRKSVTVTKRVEWKVEGEGPKPPDPPVPDVKPGKRQLVVIRESSVIDTATANILTSLRVGENAKWLTSRGHTLTYFDPDDLPANLKTQLGQLPSLPAFFVIDPATKAVVSAQTLPLDIEQVKALVVKGGG